MALQFAGNHGNYQSNDNPEFVARQGNFSERVRYFTQKALILLKANLTAFNLVSRDFDDTFSIPDGAETIRIPVHPRQKSGRGVFIDKFNPLTQQHIDFRVDKHYNFPYQKAILDRVWNKKDKIDMQMYAGICNMAHNIDNDVYATMERGFPHSFVFDPDRLASGERGTNVTRDFIRLNTEMTRQLFPMEGRNSVVPPEIMEALSNDIRMQYNQSYVKRATENTPPAGLMKVSGISIQESNNLMTKLFIPYNTAVSRNVTMVGGTGDAAVQKRVGNTIYMRVASGTLEVKAGMHFVIEGVNDIHEQSYSSLGTLKQFQVAEDVTIGNSSDGTPVKLTEILNPGNGLIRKDVSEAHLPDDNAGLSGNDYQNLRVDSEGNSIFPNSGTTANPGIPSTGTPSRKSWVTFDAYQNASAAPGAGAKVRFTDLWNARYLNPEIFDDTDSVAELVTAKKLILDAAGQTNPNVVFNRGYIFNPMSFKMLFVELPPVQTAPFSGSYSAEGVNVSITGDWDMKNYFEQFRMDARAGMGIIDPRLGWVLTEGARIA